MSIETDTVPKPKLVTSKPVTDVKSGNKKMQDQDKAFAWAIGIIVVAWLIVFALYWSLREYNV